MSKLYLPWDFFGVISCDFVDHYSRSVTADPRNHTNQQELETEVIRVLTQSL